MVTIAAAMTGAARAAGYLIRPGGMTFRLRIAETLPIEFER
jgi:hypothetical protein